MGGVIQSVSTTDNREGVKSISLGAEKPVKEEVVEESSFDFLGSITLPCGCPQETLRKYAIHYLLLHDDQNRSEACEGIVAEMRAAELEVNETDTLRLDLLLSSLCTESEDSKCRLSQSVVDGLSLSSWVWKPSERKRIMKWRKLVAKSGSQEEAEPKPKRVRKAKNTDENESYIGRGERSVIRT